MTIIAYVFPKLQTAKYVVRQMSKKFCFRRPFDKQNGKRSQTLMKSVRQLLYHIYWSLSRTLSSEKLLLVMYKILGLLVSTLPADAMYSILNREYLTEPIHMQLSKKQKHFSEFLSAFSKSRSNFKHFEKDNDHYTLSSSEITDSKNGS